MPAQASARTYNQNHSRPQIHAGQAAREHLLDVELPVGVAARPHGDGQSVFDHDGSSPRRLAGLRDSRNGARRSFFRVSRVRWSCFTARLSVSRGSPRTTRAIPSPCSSASTRPVIDCRSMKAILADTDTLMVFGLDHLVSEQDGGAGGDRSHSRVVEARRRMSSFGAPSRRRLLERS